MTTYRTGKSWGVTIVREGHGEPNPGNCGLADDEFVAVVVNGDRALAERICALLNGAMRQVAVVAALGQAAADMRSGYPGHGHPIEYVNGWEESAAFAEGFAGVDTARPARACDCAHDGLDAMFHRRPCPIAELRHAARKLGYELVQQGADHG